MKNDIKALWKQFVTYFPGEIGYRVRRGFYSRKGAKFGKNVLLSAGVWIEHPDKFAIGNHSGIGNLLQWISTSPDIQITDLHI